jgi:hypothetical protein
MMQAFYFNMMNLKYFYKSSENKNERKEKICPIDSDF